MIKPARGAVLDLTNPLSRGLVFASIFNEGTGDIVHDLSGNGNNGAFVNIDPATDWVGGDKGGAINFNSGSSDHISVPYSSVLDNPDAFSICVKAKSDIAGSAYPDSAFLVDLGDVGARGYGIFLLGGTNKVVGYYNSQLPSADNELVAGEWHIYTLTYDGATLIFYQDGIEHDSVSTGTTTIDNNPLKIGSRSKSTPFNFWEGQIESVYLWSRALSATEVILLQKDLYQMLRQRTAPQIFGGVLPSRIPYGKLINDDVHGYMTGNMKFHISGLDFIFRDNQLIETSGGSSKYILYNNVMELQ